MNVRAIAPYLDHTLLKPTAARDEILVLCREAASYGFAAVCVNPSRVALAVSLLSGTPVKVCSVVGFPLGANLSQTKAFEASAAVAAGATEVDMVVDLGAASDGDFGAIAQDVAAVRSVVSEKVVLKVIIESAALRQEHKEAIALAVERGGADFVKTSTGMHASGGASIDDVKLLRRVLQPKTRIKASGGIRDLATAMKMIEAGASRLGTSSGVAIAEAFRASRE